MMRWVAFLFCSMLFACSAEQPWTVIHQATPAPYDASAMFVLQPFSYDGLHVGQKTVEEYLADKSPNKQASFIDEEHQTEKFFRGAFTSGTGGIHTGIATPNAYKIQVHVVYIEPGYYVGFAQKAGELRATIHVLDPSGAVVDDLVMTRSSGAISVGERLHDMGDSMGEATADYLRVRLGLKK